MQDILLVSTTFAAHHKEGDDLEVVPLVNNYTDMCLIGSVNFHHLQRQCKRVAMDSTNALSQVDILFVIC